MSAKARLVQNQRKRANGHGLKEVKVSLGTYLQSAVTAHQAGRLDEAKSAYQAILKVQPQNVDALHLLGMLHHQQGENESALDLMHKALALHPDNLQCLNNLGSMLNALGRAVEAEPYYRRAIELAPSYAEAHSNLGIVLNQVGRRKEAIEAFEAALEIEPTLAAAHRELGAMALQKREYDRAERHLRSYLQRVPNDAMITSNLAFLAQQAGRLDEAEELFQRALSLSENSAELRHNLRSVKTLRGQGESAREEFRSLLREKPDQWILELGLARNVARKGGYESAKQALDDILDVHCDRADVWNDVGAILLDLGKNQRAREVLARAVEIDPELADAHNNLGGAEMRLDHPEKAVPAFKKAIAQRPQYIQAYVNLIRALRKISQHDQALTYAHAALLQEGYHPRHSPGLMQTFRALCDFDGLAEVGDIWSNCEHIETTNLPAILLDVLVSTVSREDVARLKDLVLRWAGSVEQMAATASLPSCTVPHTGKLRVGILSSDLRQHSVSRFLLPLIRDHNRDHFNLYCYTPIPAPNDPVQQVIKSKVHKFTHVDNMTDREVAATIQADHIDVLLELNGFTENSRMSALAYRPAPVQMSWLGYPFTCGLKDVDYVIMDRFLVPTDETTLVEEPIIMPDAWLCFGKFADIKINPTLPQDRNGALTFGTLNSCYKYTREMIGLWGRVMAQIPNSRFLMVRPEASSLSLCRSLITEFGKYGIEPERLFFLNNRADGKHHLSYYNEIDISLDTFPLTGGTTTCEALWMGVPVVSLVGEAYHQRISYAILQHCGLDELCVDSADDFVARAVALAGDRAKLAAWRTQLREVMCNSPLCDEPRFLHQFQEMIDQVVQLHGLR